MSFLYPFDILPPSRPGNTSGEDVRHLAYIASITQGIDVALTNNGMETVPILQVSTRAENSLQSY